MTTQAQGKSGKMARLISSLALIAAVACGKKDASSQSSTSASTLPARIGTEDVAKCAELVRQRKPVYELMKPLIDELTYLQAGLTQGMSFSDFVVEERKVEAEFMKLNAGEDDYQSWGRDCKIPAKLQQGFHDLRVGLRFLQQEWDCKIKTPDNDRCQKMFKVTIDGIPGQIMGVRQSCKWYFEYPPTDCQ